MAAELRLNVALDLAYFRQQLPKLSQAAAGYRLPLQVKFDARQLRKELNKLTGRREFRINLNDTAIKSALDSTQKLEQALKRLQTASRGAAPVAPIGVQGLSKTASKGGVNKAQIAKLYEALAIAGVEGFQRGVKKNRDEMVAEIGGLSADTISGLLNGLKSGDPKLKAAARSLGSSLINSFKAVLGIASPSREFKYLGEFAAEGFEIGLTQGLKEAEASAMNRMRAMLAALKGEASKFGPALMMASGMGGGQQKGLREALLMAAGMGGLYTPETQGQRMFRQAREGIAGRYGAVPSATFAGGGSGTYNLGRQAIQGPQLPVRGVFDSTPSPPRIAGLLGPSGTAEATRAAALALKELEARARSAARSAAVFAEDAARASRRRGLEVASGQVPLGGGGRYLPPGGGGGGGGRSGGFGGIGPNFGRDLGRGFVGRGGGIAGEIANEFGNATKQVLLFGTAYKALAAITSLPGNIANATASLQSFRNQLEAVTGGGQVMADSLELIESTVARFNVPVQSARDGFVRLYASMKPAGIDLGTINNLFTGLSATASTFGMSADQVDRMTYALAQMASKGQIMTEELKGQLGDVFPQAVSLFAEATGFMNDTMDDAAKSQGMSQFLQALEDGAFKGEKMKQVLSNVGIALKKFEGSADKAAGSFQNQMNKLNNALTGFYESFSPAAGAFLGEFVTPMVQALTEVGDAVKLALSGDEIENNDLAAYFRDELFPQLINIKDGLVTAAQTVGQFAQALAVVLRPLAQLILGNQQFVSVLTRAIVLLGGFRVAAAAVNATGIIPLIRNIIRYNGVFRIFLTQTAAGSSGLTALRNASVATGVGMRQAAVGVRVLATAIRTALVASAIGIALVAISALIEKIMQLKATAESIEGQRGGAGTRIKKAAEMAGTEGMKAEQARVGAEISSREKSIGILERLQQGETISEKERAQLKATGSLPSGLMQTKGGFTAKSISYAGGGAFKEDIAGDVGEVLENNKKSLAAFTEGMDELTQEAAKNAAVVDARAKQQAQMDFTGLGGGGEGDGGGKGGKTTPATLLDLTRQLNKAKEEGRLIDEIQLQYQIDVVNANQEQKDAVGRMIALEEARHKQQMALQDLGEKIGKEMYEQIEREKEGRREVNRLMVEARFAAGQITAQERDRLLFIQGQIDALDQFKKIPGVTPDDVAAFEARQAATPEPGSIGELYKNTKDELDDLTDSTKFLGEAANGIGSAFAKSFTDILTGAQTWREGLAGAFKSVASMFADMVTQMLAKWAALQIIGLFSPGGNSGGAKPPLPGSVALTAANGAVWEGGFTPFANGGVVKGPTLGLVGEGRFNEAVVPLPDGKKIPVELGGGAGNNISTNIVVNMNNGQASSQMSGSGGQTLGREIEGAVRNVIMKESRPGGLIYSGR
jgi:tape measure domain-containing protein